LVRAAGDLALVADRQAGGKPFEGKIVFVAPDMDPVSQLVRVWAKVKNRGNLLRQGLEARMTILPESVEATAAN
jgi:multidrug efflux pump subunit AcrA (membrane-fusion protein)